VEKSDLSHVREDKFKSFRNSALAGERDGWQRAGSAEGGAGLECPAPRLLQADAVEVGVGIATLAGQSVVKTAEDDRASLESIVMVKKSPTEAVPL